MKTKPITQTRFNRQVCQNLLAAGTAGILAMTLGTTAYAQSKGSITVNAYSGPWEAAMKACFFDPFSEEAGIEVVINTGVTTATYAKLRQQGAASGFDVVWLDAGYSEQAWDEGLIQAIPMDAVPNMKNLTKSAVYTTKDNKVYALGTGYFSWGLAYNPKAVDPAPTSWLDLWDPKYAGRVYSPSPAQSLFTPLMLHLNTILGGSNNNLDPVIKKFKELKAALYYDTSGVANATIQSGEVVLGIYYPNTVAQLAKQSVSIKFAAPKEGVVSSDIRMHLVNGTPKKALAERLINYVAQPKPLECIAEKILLGPPLDKPSLSDETRKGMPWGENGTIDNLIKYDWNEINKIRPTLRQLWNRRVVGQ